MAAHGICFDFYWPKPREIGQNGSAAAADDRLTDCIAQRKMLITEGWTLWTADSDQKS